MSQSLAQTTYDRMRSDIIFGRLEAGAKLRLEDLRGLYGVSVPTLREVLNRLAADGFVRAEDQRGFLVAATSAQNLRDLADLRILLEVTALEQAFERGDVGWESEVVAAHHRLARVEAGMLTGDHTGFADWKRYDGEFHRALISACGSEELLSMHSMVFDKYLRYQMQYLTFRGDLATHEHLALKEAALERDFVKAKALLTAHISAGVSEAIGGDGALIRAPSTA